MKCETSGSPSATSTSSAVHIRMHGGRRKCETSGSHSGIGDIDIHRRRRNRSMKCDASGSPSATPTSTKEDIMGAGSAKRAAVPRRYQCPAKKTECAQEVRNERQSIDGIKIHWKMRTGRMKCETSGSSVAALTISTSTEENRVGAESARRAAVLRRPPNKTNI